MVPSKMTTFYKSENCPGSNELLDFQKGDIARNRSGEISEHLGNCEFCDAEVEFYSHFPLEDGAEQMEYVEIPGPLYELAEALLKKRHADSSALDSLLKGKTRVTAGKA
jgi:hypothetical protein